MMSGKGSAFPYDIKNSETTPPYGGVAADVRSEIWKGRDLPLIMAAKPLGMK
jgi:hypothetical protein